MFDTSKAIDVEANYKFTYEISRRVLLGLDFFIDFFDPFSESELNQLEYCIQQICEYMNTLPKNSEQRSDLKDMIRGLSAKLYSKPGNAGIVFRYLPNIHELNRAQDKRGFASNDRMRSPEGW